MNGIDLKVRRTQALVKAQDLAAVLRERFPESYWSPSKVSKVERLAIVDPMLADQYVTALDTFTTNVTSEAVA